MDTKKTIDTKQAYTTAALLWVGPHTHVLNNVVHYLQQVYCANNGCSTCTSCVQIQEQQHHAIMWLSPDKSYTVEDIDRIQKTASFALDTNQSYFFVIQKAECLTTLCSNRLLKTLEEPTPGYHFILLTERKDALLETLQSRCHTRFCYEQTSEVHPLLSYFTQANPDPLVFMQAIEKYNMHENEIAQLLDTLLLHWTNQYKQAIRTDNKAGAAQAQQHITTLKQALTKPPMPGSGALFLKNIFLELHYSENN